MKSFWKNICLLYLIFAAFIQVFIKPPNRPIETHYTVINLSSTLSAVWTTQYLSIFCCHCPFLVATPGTKTSLHFSYMESVSSTT